MFFCEDATPSPVPPPPPLHSDKYYTNTSSLPSMKNVLVLTMPNTRSYTISTDLTGKGTVSTQGSARISQTTDQYCVSVMNKHTCSVRLHMSLFSATHVSKDFTPFESSGVKKATLLFTERVWKTQSKNKSNDRQTWKHFYILNIFSTHRKCTNQV